MRFIRKAGAPAEKSPKRLHVEPAELARKLVKEMEDHKVSRGDRTVGAQPLHHLPLPRGLRAIFASRSGDHCRSHRQARQARREDWSISCRATYRRHGAGSRTGAGLLRHPRADGYIRSRRRPARRRRRGPRTAGPRPRRYAPVAGPAAPVAAAAAPAAAAAAARGRRRRAPPRPSRRPQAPGSHPGHRRRRGRRTRARAPGHRHDAGRPGQRVQPEPGCHRPRQGSRLPRRRPERLPQARGPLLEQRPLDGRRPGLHQRHHGQRLPGHPHRPSPHGRRGHRREPDTVEGK